MQQSTQRSRRHRSRVTRAAMAATASALASAGLAGPALANQQPSQIAYRYTTVINKNDQTFNQLLGINNHNVISGYFGSGAQGHANRGYLTSTLAANAGLMDLGFLPENVPGSVQTQVTGLNDNGVTVGFWSDQNNVNQVNDNFGFYAIDGRFVTVNFPTTNNASPSVNQLLGVNDSDIAAGFYTDANGNNHGYTYNITTRRFHEVKIAAATSVTATAINNRDDVAGIETDANGNQDGYLLTRTGHLTVLDVPGAMSTQALGVNDRREVVGVYTDANNNTHGFTWTAQNGFQTVDDPNGIGTTTVNGVNDAGDLVGFYTDAGGNVDGMLATP
jgi:hypothetical protein